MFKKILFPTDQSPHSNKAQKVAMDIAQKFNSELVVLNIYKLPTQLYTAESIYYMYLDEIENKIVEINNLFLEKVKKEAESKNISVKTIIEKGSAPSMIIEQSIKENCDLIVMGTRGLNALERALIGSVSNYVVHHSKCPVMLIN
jgi:nucleotide-binding universal stress UspA family protein